MRIVLGCIPGWHPRLSRVVASTPPEARDPGGAPPAQLGTGLRPGRLAPWVLPIFSRLPRRSSEVASAERGRSPSPQHGTGLRVGSENGQNPMSAPSGGAGDAAGVGKRTNDTAGKDIFELQQSVETWKKISVVDGIARPERTFDWIRCASDLEFAEVRKLTREQKRFELQARRARGDYTPVIRSPLATVASEKISGSGSKEAIRSSESDTTSSSENDEWSIHSFVSNATTDSNKNPSTIANAMKNYLGQFD